ncbi:MAG: hypothetical protein CMF52_07115, partial [Legionellales bacterium]|nr:hypothetical protein [Legionellales bacterium]
MDPNVLLSRYYSQKYIRSFFDVTVVAIILLGMSSLINELRISSAAYTSADAIIYTFYRTPASIIRADSIIFCIATIVFFLRLRKSKELLVGHIFGVSMMQVLRGLVPLVIVLITLVTVNREWLAPQVSAYAKVWRLQKTEKGTIYTTINNKVWFYTQSGFLSAQMVTDNPKQLQDVAYYEFENDQLLYWYFSDKVNYELGDWVAPDGYKKTINNQYINTERIAEYKLPIRVKPRVIEGARLMPEFATLRQIIDSMYRGGKYGISNHITWMMLTARITRPINLFLIFIWVFVVLEHVTLPRFKGLVARLFLTILFVISERVAYEFITTAKTNA